LSEDSNLTGTLIGYEGKSSAWYWEVLNTVLDDAVFLRRIQRNPVDPFNSCLNYVYGILYGKVEGGLLAYGLDPLVGLIHAEGYNKKCLVYDCIEPFSPWAELMLVALFRNKTMTSSHFEYGEDKLSITKMGRKELIKAFVDFLNEKTMMNGRRISRNDQITAICSQLAQAVKNFDIRGNPNVKVE
jgi:CRISPR-associated protein Cas1